MRLLSVWRRPEWQVADSQVRQVADNDISILLWPVLKTMRNEYSNFMLIMRIREPLYTQAGTAPLSSILSYPVLHCINICPTSVPSEAPVQPPHLRGICGILISGGGSWGYSGACAGLRVGHDHVTHCTTDWHWHPSSFTAVPSSACLSISLPVSYPVPLSTVLGTTRTALHERGLLGGDARSRRRHCTALAGPSFMLRHTDPSRPETSEKYSTTPEQS
jgi:hypothetical protein